MLKKLRDAVTIGEVPEEAVNKAAIRASVMNFQLEEKPFDF